MKMMKKLLFLCLISFLSCTSFREPQCTGVKDFKVNKVDMQGISADITLGIHNPNPVGFSVYRSKFDVFYDGVLLGKAKSKRRVHIKPNADKDYAFTINGSFKDMNMMDVMKLVGKGGRGDLKVIGDIKAGKFFIRKRFPIEEKQRVGL